MAFDGGLNVASKVGVHGGSRVLRHERQHFWDFAPGRNRGAEQRYRSLVVFHYHLDPFSDHLLLHGREVLRDFGFTHVQFRHIFDYRSSPSSSASAYFDRSTFPGNAFVIFPSSITGTPFTSTNRIPSES